MSDDALTSWLADGAPVALSAEASAARRHTEFARRFSYALYPAEDLGETCEAHEEAVARNVYAIHQELNALGEKEYDAVWWKLTAKRRAAIKAYIEIAKKL